MLSQISGIITMKTEKTEMIMKYFDVNYKVAKQYEIILKVKQLRQIKAWYETKKGDGTFSAESETVLIEILNNGRILKKAMNQNDFVYNKGLLNRILLMKVKNRGLTSYGFYMDKIWCDGSPH